VTPLAELHRRAVLERVERPSPVVGEEPLLAHHVGDLDVEQHRNRGLVLGGRRIFSPEQARERLAHALQEEPSLHDRRRLVVLERLKQLAEVADLEPLPAQVVAGQGSPVRNCTGEERAVETAGAGTREDVEDAGAG
jgi:hypothetical protein